MHSPSWSNIPDWYRNYPYLSIVIRYRPMTTYFALSMKCLANKISLNVLCPTVVITSGVDTYSIVAASENLYAVGGNVWLDVWSTGHSFESQARVHSAPKIGSKFAKLMFQ